jgi:hypothetical protein
MILSTHGIVGSQIVQATGLLAEYPGAAAAFSLRLLRSTYTGSAIRVRRTNLDEMDIGFASTGALDTADLLAFTGTGALDNGFITTWYDQSGNGYNATETSALNQPQIVSAGSVINVNSKPALSFDSTNDRLTIANSESNLKFLHSNLSTIITVNQMNTTIAKALMGSNGGTGSNTGFYLGTSAFLQHVISSAGTNITINNTTTAVSANTQYLNFILGNPASSTLNARSLIYINNSSVNQNNSNFGTLSTANSRFDVQLGSWGNNVNNMNGFYQEIIFYPSSQSSNQTGIQNNINSFYSIY